MKIAGFTKAPTFLDMLSVGGNGFTDLHEPAYTVAEAVHTVQDTDRGKECTWTFISRREYCPRRTPEIQTCTYQKVHWDQARQKRGQQGQDRQ